MIQICQLFTGTFRNCNDFAEENSAKNSGEYNPWPGFKFTGALRPQRVVS